MQGTVYIWCFPGIGKSSVHSSIRFVDADCKAFEFYTPNASSSSLHGNKTQLQSHLQPSYPENYFRYISQLSDVDIAFINCHLRHLAGMDNTRLLLLFPSPALKEEYLCRYRERGDHPSFIAQMDEDFERIIAFARSLPYRKVEITTPNTYLQDLLEGKDGLMSQFITKPELTVLFEKCIEHQLYTPPLEYADNSPSALSQLVFEGVLPLDVQTLQNQLSQKEAEIEKERIKTARRGGLTHDELRDKITQGLVNGVLSIRHGEISPYSFGYCVQYGNPGGKAFNRWECYCTFPEVAETVTCNIEKDRQHNQVFSEHKVQKLDIQALLRDIGDSEQRKLTSFSPESECDYKRRGQYTGHVATLRDVHEGLALDGIVMGHFSGDYSSVTTNRQNELMKTLVIMKGFCLDAVERLSPDDRAFAIHYLKTRGTDISTSEKLVSWIHANPEKCALPHNREHTLPSLSSHIEKADSRAKVRHDIKSASQAEPER